MTQQQFDENYFYGQVYTNYDGFNDWPGMAEDLCRDYSFTSFLDIGCGCGNLINELRLLLAKQGKTAVDIAGIDVSPYAVAKVNKPYIIEGDCRTLPYVDQRFQIVYIMGTYAYLDNEEEILKAIAEAYRVCKEIIIFEDVYSAPEVGTEDYDPYRKLVLSQADWQRLWQKVIKPNDTINWRGDELIIHKQYA
ncbi:MAG: Methyltransferase domain protein [Candidatus Magasanikbacteria bacterium GW2011_GWA2_42_32]|uniref:Methyltransferase domain protein n=1 Tax=Candidatus Magasanikbacteria bacterium GW2011_GWA2_42_32 TaxID=1619039 RepID=A0A0G1CWZ3_9BACT|nr:MAG: Methyltransferase domain protein [Candidatus Magasanikbacteria bacterium GW2011_GWA2_42_32]